METSRLRANMKQKYAKQCICQQKQFGYHGGRLFWSFPVCILLFFFLIYKLSCILKQKLFWHEKKTNWRKMSKKTSKSFKSRHSFPNGCDIFQQETARSWHFPESFNCDALAFCGGRENNFPSQIFTLYHIFTGLSLKWDSLWYGSLQQHSEPCKQRGPRDPSSQDGNSRVSKRI